MEEFNMEQKMLIALLGAELAKIGKDFTELGGLLIEIDNAKDTVELMNVVKKYFPPTR